MTGGRADLVLNLLDASAYIGATVQEVLDATGGSTIEVVDVLADLVAEGRAVRLCETRNGWPVHVLPGDVRGRQIEETATTGGGV